MNRLGKSPRPAPRSRSRGTAPGTQAGRAPNRRFATVSTTRPIPSVPRPNTPLRVLVALGLLLAWLAGRLYERESILG